MTCRRKRRSGFTPEFWYIMGFIALALVFGIGSRVAQR